MDEGFKEIPDVIALQEAPGWWWCPTDWNALRDYAALDRLISNIRTETGVLYRIAYLVATYEGGGEGGCGINGGTATGGCKMWGGLAMLYNPNRLRNATGEAQDPQTSHDDLLRMGVHFRRSLPCCNTEDGHAAVCGLVDGPNQTDKCGRPTGGGLAWVSTYYEPAKSVTDIPVAFARFEFRPSPGRYVHLYNVHIHNQEASRMRANELIQAMEQRFGQTRLFPPVVLGDFNGGEEQFDDFDVAGWLSIDGILIGKRDKFPSAFNVSWRREDAQALPPGAVCNEGAPPILSVLWSDHCAIMTSFQWLNPRPAPGPSGPELTLTVFPVQTNGIRLSVRVNARDRATGVKKDGTVVIHGASGKTGVIVEYLPCKEQNIRVPCTGTVTVEHYPTATFEVGVDPYPSPLH